MIETMSDKEMEELLTTRCYGHLGCLMDDGRPYVVPITYAYGYNCLFSFSFEGQKIDCMRSNPDVCVQVEQALEGDRWRSVIAWGEFEELTEEQERTNALTLLLNRLWNEGVKEHSIFVPFRNSEKSMEAALNDEGCVLFRVNIEEMTGRYEKYE